MSKKKWTPPEETDRCPYHPEIKMVWRQKRIGEAKPWWFQCCDECEWNPPDVPSVYDNGRTSPDILTHLDRLE